MAQRKANMMNLGLWASFFAFVAVAIWCKGDAAMLDFSGGVGISRLVLIIAWLAFVAYSIHASRHENLFRTIGVMNGLYWGRQIGTDLYISVALSIGLAYLVTGSGLETLLWAAVFIPFANLAILLFVILYLDRIVAMAAALS